MSSTKKVTASKQSTTAAVPSARNPKDSMKSTWRADRTQWSLPHWAFDIIKLHPTRLDRKAPVHPKTDKVPAVPDWQPHAWILMNSLPAVALHQLYVYYTGKNLGYIAAFLLYAVGFQVIGGLQFWQMCKIGQRYGFLDGDKHDRDEIPDHAVGKVLLSLELTAFMRAAMLVLCSYNPSQAPLDARWWLLPLEAGLYPIVLDFFFYWYHRVMHQYDSLWKYHRTHHLTKHPNPLLTLYADEEQEFFDIAGIPIMAFATMRLLGFPMSMYGWWFCCNYVQFVELAGHSGLRIVSTPPGLFMPLLRYFECELGIEDHDLHHRTGWRKSHNYGKQARLWDRIFGTLTDRVETSRGNIDWKNTATIFC